MALLCDTGAGDQSGRAPNAMSPKRFIRRASKEQEQRRQSGLAVPGIDVQNLSGKLGAAALPGPLFPDCPDARKHRRLKRKQAALKPTWPSSTIRQPIAQRRGAAQAPARSPADPAPSRQLQGAPAGLPTGVNSAPPLPSLTTAISRLERMAASARQGDPCDRELPTRSLEPPAHGCRGCLCLDNVAAGIAGPVRALAPVSATSASRRRGRQRMARTPPAAVRSSEQPLEPTPLAHRPGRPLRRDREAAPGQGAVATQLDAACADLPPHGAGVWTSGKLTCRLASGMHAPAAEISSSPDRGPGSRPQAATFLRIHTDRPRPSSKGPSCQGR